MNPEDYDAWYETPRGRWIGEAEYSLLRSLLQPEMGSSLLDIGCGTGYFTRLFARDTQGFMVGIDPDRDWLAYARKQAAGAETFVRARAEALPFPDHAFDCTISVTALCFIANQAQALREMIRVTRRRFVLGLLNRRSLLYLEKGRAGGTGAYRDAHWHTASEVRTLLQALPVTRLSYRSAIFLPQGTPFSRIIELLLPRSVLWGGFLAVAGDVSRGAPDMAFEGSLDKQKQSSVDQIGGKK